jgi:hypothetical protein
VLLVDRQHRRQTERHAARNDRDLVDRIRMRQHDRQQRVPDSWIAVMRFSFSLMIIERRSAPMSTLSFANSKSTMRTTFWL